MSTIEKLQKLSEREDHVEFKSAEHDYPFAGGKKTDPRDRRHCVLGYVVALANERGGRLVLGDLTEDGEGRSIPARHNDRKKNTAIKNYPI